MTATVAALWRHPIKAVGAEPLTETRMIAGQTLPGDRVWAVAHEAAKLSDGWSPCANFNRGAKAPALMAVTARLEGDAVRLSHPDRDDLTVSPETEPEALLDWVRPLVPEGRAAPARIIRAEARGMTDSAFPSISILNRASLSELSRAAGHAMDERRFRGNVWVEGLEPWQEFDLVDREIRLGDATLAVRERIGRCRATHADPATGSVDTDTLGLLRENFGHTQFGIYAEVIEGGPVALGDALTVL
ncbi:MOSC domain-containing protein [Tranquillimonas rosea]|uniref:MOSC domain-containing protein n=1 Tax=Tranquillimonas rosea TaxID=641238 RepID=UPI003BABA74E